MAILWVQTLVAAPVEVCFDAARDLDLHVASHAASGERAVAGRTSGLIGPGETVTWRARHFGFVQTLTSQISAFDRPRHFQDRMLQGAFRSWVHDHHFRPVEGGTLMTDEVEFHAPLGPLGRLAEAAVLERYLHRLLERHHWHLRAAAEMRAAAVREVEPPWPLYPLTVRWPDEKPEVLENEETVCCNLEFFDSEDDGEPVEVVDALGRPVRLQVERLEIAVCELLPRP